ncbi:hypothetical protein ACVWYH_008755 [Bradyrhizobium sp. GM24.11]
MIVDAIDLHRRHRGRTHHVIGGPGLALVEQFSRQQAALAPPGIGILRRHGVGCGSEDHLSRIVDAVLLDMPLRAAQHIAEIATRISRHVIKIILGLVLLAVDRRAGLDDRERVFADPLGRALSAGVVLGAEALVHAGAMILGTQEIVKGFVGIRLATLRQLLRAPGLADQTRGPLAVAFGDQHAGEREVAFGAGRPVHREGMHGGRVGLLLPQPRLGTPAQ